MAFMAMVVTSLVPLLWVAALVAAMYLCYLPCHRFRNTGINYLTPIPLFGDMTSVIFRLKHVLLKVEQIYKSFPEDRFVGMAETVRPVVVIRDLELVKRIIVKDFEHFYRHTAILSKEVDPIYGNAIFFTESHDLREKQLPYSRFVTGYRVRQMVSPMVAVGDRMVAEIRARIQESSAKYWDVNFDVFCSHTNFDLIAACFLGLKCDSRDSPRLYDAGIKLLKLRSRQVACFLGLQIVPNFMKVIGAKMYPESDTDLFKKLLTQALKARKDENIGGQDIFGTISGSVKEGSKDWYTDTLPLMLAGFDPVTAALGMLVHELALNPEVQERLAQEVLEADRRNGGNIDYNSIQGLTYMDMVVSELLRMRVNGITDRMCTKDYNLGRPNDSATQDYIIRKGEGVYIPVAAIHYDPQYFPEPAKFDPERFSAENRHKIPPFAYNPFGVGPRMCLGSIFAKVVMKVLVYQLLRGTRVSACERTSAAIRPDPASIAVRSQGGSWVRLALRQSSGI